MSAKLRIERILIPNNGPLEAKQEAAISEAVKMARKKGLNSVTMIVESVTSPPGLEGALGRQNMERLKKDREVQIDGVLVKMVGTKGFDQPTSNDVILGVYLHDDKSIARINDLVQCPGIVYLPLTSDRGEEWKATWNPICTTTEYDHIPDFYLDASMEAELSKLPAQIGHPLDDDRMKKGLKKLRKSYHAVDRKVIRRWALRSGFDSADAGKIMKWFK